MTASASTHHRRNLPALLALFGLVVAASLQSASWTVCQTDCCGAFDACPVEVSADLESPERHSGCATGCCGSPETDPGESPAGPGDGHRPLRPDCCSVCEIDLEPGTLDPTDPRPADGSARRPVAVTLPVFASQLTECAGGYGRAPPRVDRQLLQRACIVLLS